MLVILSVYEMFSTSLDFGLCGRKFVLRLFGELLTCIGVLLTLYWDVVYNHHIWLRDVHLQTYLPIFVG